MNAADRYEERNAESDRLASRTKRQFSLRGFVAFATAICVLCSVIFAADHSLTSGLLAFGIAARLLAVLVVGAILGFVIGNIPGSMMAGLIGVVVADVVWCGFLAVFEAWELHDFIMNPLPVIALIVCPPAAARSRARALTIGISISAVLPPVVAAWLLRNLPTGPGVGGTGLAAVVIVLGSLVAMFTGVVATLGARFSVEVVQAMWQRVGQQRDSEGSSMVEQ